MPEKIKVLHLIDSLQPGGAETLAVNIFNALNKKGIDTYLISTRTEGILKSNIQFTNRYYYLNKKSTLDFIALYKILKIIKKNNIQVIHAHTNSYFTATLVKFIYPSLRIIWHNHTGKNTELKGKKLFALRISSLLFNAIIHVNKELLNWGKKNLQVKKQFYFSHFPHLQYSRQKVYSPGFPSSKRIIHIAGWRSVKDHLTLLETFSLILQRHPDATLHLIGPLYGDSYERTIKQKIKNLKIEKNVFIHGTQNHIGNWLNQASIGVLSSRSEGLPVSLLEYGMAGLPVVATAVGEIPSVLGNGKYGQLVPPGNSQALADAILYYLEHPKEAQKKGEMFKKHVLKNYSEEVFINKLVSLYFSL